MNYLSIEEYLFAELYTTRFEYIELIAEIISNYLN